MTITGMYSVFIVLNACNDNIDCGKTLLQWSVKCTIATTYTSTCKNTTFCIF